MFLILCIWQPISSISPTNGNCYYRCIEYRHVILQFLSQTFYKIFVNPLIYFPFVSYREYIFCNYDVVWIWNEQGTCLTHNIHLTFRKPCLVLCAYSRRILLVCLQYSSSTFPISYFLIKTNVILTFVLIPSLLSFLRPTLSHVFVFIKVQHSNDFLFHLSIS